MIHALTLLTPALLAGVLFSGMHAYAGLRLIERPGIVPALAITQFAALGASVSLLLGRQPQSIVTYGLSFVIALIPAAVLPRLTNQRELASVIGFIVAAAGMMIVFNFTPLPADHIKMLLGGDMASVSRHTLLLITAMYLPAAAMIWRTQSDTWLYCATAWIVAFSAGIAGVLLVAAYLIVPAASARRRFIAAWSVGAIGTAIGILLSFKIDLPTGATIVCILGLTLLLTTGVRLYRCSIMSASSRNRRS